ncbi:MAG: hypothetical protein AAGE94_02840 [Acidobacteriota bacterium]
MVSHPIKNLLSGLVDYAGLFPPARLEMDPAVAEFARQRRTDEAWILGRFVVPTARLDELSAAMDRQRHPDDDGIWPLSALVGGDPDEAKQRIDAFDSAHAGRAAVTSIETKPATVDDVVRTAAAFDTLEVFYEIAYGRETAPLLDAVAAHGGRAKIRTGGVTQDAFPSVADVSRFIHAVRRADVPFKATAGLHHPLRGEYRLTYEDDAPDGTMHGFLNVFLAAAFVHQGAMRDTEVKELLGERRSGALDFSSVGVTWRGHRLSADELAAARRTFVLSYGSCSFQEPVDDLKRLHLL